MNLLHAPFKFGLMLLIAVFSNVVFAECNWETGEQVCNYYTDFLCPNTNWCANDECYGKNFGEEVMLVPGGVYPKFWIARTDGDFFEWGTYHCDVTSNPGVTMLEIPIFASGHKGCVVGLLTDQHSYLEFFAKDPDQECVAWVECQCD